MNSEAVEALERREYERALALLESDLASGPEAELHALAGLANFQLERYDAAAQHYTAALQFQSELAALQADMDRHPRAVWRHYPRDLEININA